MNGIWKRIKQEPALVTGVVSAAIALAISFGIGLSEQQVGAIMAFVVAILAIVTRQAVTPNPTVDKRIQATRDALQRRQP